ncbi:MAG: alpha/beta fold hydrolase [Sterolibacterium sp.]|nr:alpha/beta fold hydrolase [Sterolibacterium sp.]
MSERLLIPGPSGQIEIQVDDLQPARGLALIGHPHPLFGGTADNKVVTTLARTLRSLGYITVRPSFRGVGASTGEHDHGEAETDDLLAVLAWAEQRFGKQPTVLAGFSFGAHVVTRVAKVLTEHHQPAERLVLVGTAAGFIEGARSYQTAAVAPDTIVIHGSADTTVPLANVLAWAEPLELPIQLIPGADHFFHRKLHLIRNIIRAAWQPPASAA